ncbi:LytR C-terminal domain-containing protein [Cellulomonas fimi]|uniref:LytR C-terminal domain-containing protein n=1 Tax=Cellulomonas fimi TaxID=1708 RepID=A0A7Y0QG90_CELFI|nr:LytR C-terminal domain-containing protein [Cellulomonas fimi]NMR18644.1 LytR C-terminal domain-containing protein [Cellulomonas fimi]
MTEQRGADRERTLRRRHLHERQAVIFGILIAGLAVAALGGIAVYTDAIPSPISRDFTTKAADEGPTGPPPPCPPDGTLPVPYQNVQVNVLNGTDRAGLAGDVAAGLAARGFGVLGTGNAPASVAGVARIGFGAAGVGAAYTLAAHLEGVVLTLDGRPDATVDLALGAQFIELTDPAQITLDPAVPLTGVEGCVPLEEAVPAPAPVAPAPEGDGAPPA